MKKFTFLAALALATSMSAYSQDQTTSTEWTDELTTVASADDYVRTAPIAIDANLNTIVAGRYSLQADLQFGLYTFNGVTANDAFIGKYDKTGLKQWVAGVNGNAVFTAIATDAEGNIYAAGKFAAEANVLGTDGKSLGITDGDAENTTRSSAFLAKYNKDGVLLDVKTYTAEIDGSLMPEGDYFSIAEADVTINQIQVDGKYVSLSISHKGTVKIDENNLESNYCTLYSCMFDALTTVDIVYLDAATLGDCSWVATFGASEQVVEEAQYQPESVCFTVENGVVYAGFCGIGNLLLQAYTTNTTCDFDYSAYGDGIEHGFLFARMTQDGAVSTKEYNSYATTNDNSLNGVDCMKIVDGKLCVAGTFNVEGLFGGLEFKGGCDTYMLELNPATLEIIYAGSSKIDEGDAKYNAEVVTGMFTSAGSLYVTGYAETTADHKFTSPIAYKMDLTTGVMEPYTEVETYITSVAQNGGYIASVAADDYKYVIDFCDEITADIDDVDAGNKSIVRKGDTVTLSKPANISVYSTDGALVKAAKASTGISLAGLGKGVYVVKAGQKTVKINK